MVELELISVVTEKEAIFWAPPTTSDLQQSGGNFYCVFWVIVHDAWVARFIFSLSVSCQILEWVISV